MTTKLQARTDKQTSNDLLTKLSNEADHLQNKHRLGRFLKSILDGGSSTMNWLVDKKAFLKHEQSGCHNDVFFIRTELLKSLTDFTSPQTHWFSVVDAQLRKLLPLQRAGGLELENPDFAELPFLSHWLFNLARFRSREYGTKGAKHHPEWQMVDLRQKYRNATFEAAKCEMGEFCHIQNEHMGQRYFGLGNPKDNFDSQYMRTELPDIYLRPGSTNLDFAFTPTKACGSRSRYVALIKTSFDGLRQRSQVREMFKKLLEPDQYELYFLIGKGTVKRLDTIQFPWLEKKEDQYLKRSFEDENIQNEIKDYDDLIIGDFLDTYENLPIKTFLGYKFLGEKCRGKYDFVTFTDDDAILDLKNLRKLFSETSKIEPSIHCLKGNLIKMQKGK